MIATEKTPVDYDMRTLARYHPRRAAMIVEPPDVVSLGTGGIDYAARRDFDGISRHFVDSYYTANLAFLIFPEFSNFEVIDDDRAELRRAFQDRDQQACIVELGVVLTGGADYAVSNKPWSKRACLGAVECTARFDSGRAREPVVEF